MTVVSLSDRLRKLDKMNHPKDRSEEHDNVQLIELLLEKVRRREVTVTSLDFKCDDDGWIREVSVKMRVTS